MSKPQVTGKENQRIPFEGLETERVEGHVEEISCFWIAGSTFALQQPTMQEDLWTFHPSSTAQQWTRIFLLCFIDEEARMAWIQQCRNASLSRAVTSWCRPWSIESRWSKREKDAKQMRNKCPRYWKMQKHQWNVMTYNVQSCNPKTQKKRENTIEALKGRTQNSCLVVNKFPHRPVDPNPRVSEQLRATWDSLANLAPVTSVAQVAVAWWSNKCIYKRIYIDKLRFPTAVDQTVLLAIAVPLYGPLFEILNHFAKFHYCWLTLPHCAKGRFDFETDMNKAMLSLFLEIWKPEL